MTEEEYGQEMISLARREGHAPKLPQMPKDVYASVRTRAAKLADRVVTLRAMGYSQRRIAEICGCANSRVAQILAERGQ
jgi:hypothetical protein